MNLFSPETRQRRLPISKGKEMASAPQAPKVSTTTEAKMYVGTRSAYFTILRISASLAADPAAIKEIDRCEGATVSGQVKTHAKHLPSAWGTRVSGLMRSESIRPLGSSSAEFSALLSAWAMMVLMEECREILPE